MDMVGGEDFVGEGLPQCGGDLGGPLCAEAAGVGLGGLSDC